MSVLDANLEEELKKYIHQQISQIESLSDQAQEVSEYTALLIANGKDPQETLNDLQSIFDSPDLPNVVQGAYQALENYKNNQNQQSSDSGAAAPQSQSQENINATDDDIIPEKPSGINGRSIPTKPASLASRIGSNGVGKNYKSGAIGSSGRPYALQNSTNLQRALELSGIQTRPRKSRCRQFPHCPFGKECKYAHPTKACFQFPNCPNEPGTCNFLHPGEDDALIAELEKTKAEYIQKKQQSIKSQHFMQSQSGISLCKFGTMCTNLQCPFGHPTPANEDAKVIQLEWCPQNLKCEDSGCQKAHSSLSKIKEIKPTSAPGGQQEKSLETCKFGMNCTNRHCKFRHPRSVVPCREGESCTRIDCLFSHPINEDCRFDTACKNKHCLFKHPNGKAEQPTSASSMKWTKTDERQFAVPDDEVLEKAPPQEG